MDTILLMIISALIGLGLSIVLNKNKVIVSYLITFSGAFLLGVIFNEIFPEIYRESNKWVPFFIVLGLGSQLLLEGFSKGLEHGHSHLKHLRFIPAFIALLLHAFLEAVAVADHGHNHNHLLLGILVHKIPIAFILYGFICQNFKTSQARLFIFSIFLLIAPLGVLLGGYLADYYIYISAFVCGLLLHISTTILFESSKNHQINLQNWFVILLAFVLSFLL